MQVELIRTFRFDAAHHLAGAPEGHKCRRMHGHAYRVDIHVSGEVDSKTGWLMDFGDLKRIVEPVIDELDHSTLNEVPGLAATTSEMIAKFLWEKLIDSLPDLSAVTVWESDTSRCVYRGE